MSKKQVSNTNKEMKTALEKYATVQTEKMVSSAMQKLISSAVQDAIEKVLQVTGFDNVDFDKLKKTERQAKQDTVADLDARDTYVGSNHGVYNPAVENTQELLQESEESKSAGYIDPKAKARKEFFKKKNGG